MTYLANVVSLTILITAERSATLVSGTSVSSTDILTQGKHCDYSVMFESLATTEPTMKQLLTSIVLVAAHVNYSLAILTGLYINQI